MSDVLRAIRERRSIGKVKDEPIDRPILEQILEAGNWAPNHHHTEPWRFFVMTGAGRGVLADAYFQVACQQAGDGMFDPDELRRKQEAKAFRAPVVIAVAVSPSAVPNIDKREEIAAAHAAVQNMLLAAHELGLGAVWRTGEPLYHPLMKEAFGLNGSEELVALIYIGKPDMEPPEGKRNPVKDKTTWLTGE
ncbi:nitroreductase family protein [Gorillibacterium massiliense]|uniref:nitroreductase family protein n=1 Tax=Gorillibacterium massiliense TaxID=1280390 RepID=UPI0004B0352D|nr:nitroreductase [Gorillibacterium massiliense]